MPEQDKQINQDLGLGDRVIEENKTRFLNKDGSFNVYRKGVFDRGSFSPYHAILNASWPRFFLGVLSYYLIINIVFTALYFITGPNGFSNMVSHSSVDRFGQLFFYSIQIISTLGSSPLHPSTVSADILLAIESMIGLFGFAIGASLLFARFSNPATKIMFSEQAVIGPYKGMTGFMVRTINGRSNELIQVQATVTLALDDLKGKRMFRVLPLERDNVLLFPLNWTIVHPITPESPIYGLTTRDLEDRNAEFIVSLTAIDQDLSKTIFARSSYRNGEVISGKFTNIIEHDDSGRIMVDPKRVGEIEKI